MPESAASVNSPITVEKVSSAALITPGQILGRITVRKVLHQLLPRLYAASVRTVVLIARRLLSMGRYTNGNEIITYAQTSNGGVLTMLKGSLLSIGTSPRESTLMRGLDDPYTSSRPNAMIMAGTANGTRQRKSINGLALGRRSCTQYAVGVTSTTARIVAASASSSESVNVCEKSWSVKIF